MNRTDRWLTLDEMKWAARVHRAAFDDRLPWLSGLHSPTEDEAYFRSVVFAECLVFGAFEENRLTGFIAFRAGWIDHLYVLPASQGRGIGARLLAVAQSREPELCLWTFQKNAQARRFYERHGFAAVELTDGASNEEREPDIRYCWRRV